MTDVSEAALGRGKVRHQVEVADETLTYRSVPMDDLTPTGAQLAAAAGFKPKQHVVVLQVLPNGELEDVRPGETVDLRQAEGRFVIVESDRGYFVSLDEQRYPWPCRVVSGAVLRKLGGVPRDHAIYEQRIDQPDLVVEDADLIDLDRPGVEAFISRKPAWTLNVQGVEIEVDTPTIIVRDALMRAGFDAAQSWHIFLKVRGENKREVQLTDSIDLRTLGIEKLRLTPKEVNNGEAPLAPRRDFALLDADDEYLDRLGLRWETVNDAGRRWLLIHRFPVPAGYTADRALLALEIPPSYPGAQIDMFYTNPPLALISGRAIECTHIPATIRGAVFNGWSRHRGPGSPWNPAADNVSTHIALVESALLKEVGE